MRRSLAPSIALVLAVFALGACQRAVSSAQGPAPAAADEGYLASPTVTGAQIQAGQLILNGVGSPGARVRLATPVGVAVGAAVDGKGRWAVATPLASTPQIFGLSMTLKERLIQAQGYVLADERGAVTLLRAGAGAQPLARAGPPRITAFDYDRGGGAVVSGLAPAGAAITLRGDGAVVGEGAADADGRFSIPVAQPLAEGEHRLQIAGDGFQAAAVVEVSPAQPLIDGPFRSRRTALGLRADWMTPGGGVQTTLILDGAQSG